MLTARSSFGLFVLDGCMYAAGGWSNMGYIAEVEKYDPGSDSWSAVSSLNEARVYFACCAVPREVNLFDAMIAKARLG